MFFLDFDFLEAPVIKSGNEGIVNELEKQLFLLFTRQLLISPLLSCLDEVLVLQFQVDKVE